jgi:hypothetical protein
MISPAVMLGIESFKEHERIAMEAMLNTEHPSYIETRPPSMIAAGKSSSESGLIEVHWHG